MKKAGAIKIKSRKFKCTVILSIEGIFPCPRTQQRMDLLVCLSRQDKRKRGCVSCRLPQQIKRMVRP